jgi:hypothetical protein
MLMMFLSLLHAVLYTYLVGFSWLSSDSWMKQELCWQVSLNPEALVDGLGPIAHSLHGLLFPGGQVVTSLTSCSRTCRPTSLHPRLPVFTSKAGPYYPHLAQVVSFESF